MKLHELMMYANPSATCFPRFPRPAAADGGHFDRRRPLGASRPQIAVRMLLPSGIRKFRRDASLASRRGA